MNDPSHLNKEPGVTEDDARAMIGLLGEAATLQGGHQELKNFIMSGLCKLVGADSWIWTLACETVPGRRQSYTGYTHDGFDGERFTAFLKAVEHPDMAGAVKTFYERIAENNTHVTMPSQDMDPTGVMQRSEGRFLWQDMDIGPVMLSGYPLDEASFSLIGIYRGFGESEFCPRETHLVHTMLSAVPWLHAMGWPEDRGAKVPQLYPQQRVVLNLLMEGLSRKKIAEQMHLSPNTVAAYARDVFAHFGVKSQVALMKRFLG